MSWCDAYAILYDVWPYSGEKVVGTYGIPKLKIKNGSRHDGNFYFEIVGIDGKKCKAGHNIKIATKDHTGWYKCPSFKMPDKTVEIEFVVGHGCSGKWIEDQRSKCTLTPAEPEKEETLCTCSSKDGEEGESLRLKAHLGSKSINDLPDKEIKFTFNGYTFTDDTNSSGNAYVTVPASKVPSKGDHTYKAKFYGDSDYESDYCYGDVDIAEGKEGTTCHCYDAEGVEGSALDLKAKLVGDDSGRLSSKLIYFSLASYSGSDGTNSNGWAYVTVPKDKVPSKGSHQYKARFAGDSDFSSDSCWGDVKIEEGETIRVTTPGGVPSVTLTPPIELLISLSGGVPSATAFAPVHFDMSIAGGVPSVEIHLISHPSPLSDAIILQNALALAEAPHFGFEDFKITGWTKPPFTCMICGLKLNSQDDYIEHMIAHLMAYEEGQ